MHSFFGVFFFGFFFKLPHPILLSPPCKTDFNSYGQCYGIQYLMPTISLFHIFQQVTMTISFLYIEIVDAIQCIDTCSSCPKQVPLICKLFEPPPQPKFKRKKTKTKKCENSFLKVSHSGFILLIFLYFVFPTFLNLFQCLKNLYLYIKFYEAKVKYTVLIHHLY